MHRLDFQAPSTSPSSRQVELKEYVENLSCEVILSFFLVGRTPCVGVLPVYECWQADNSACANTAERA